MALLQTDIMRPNFPQPESKRICTTRQVEDLPDRIRKQLVRNSQGHDGFDLEFHTLQEATKGLSLLDDRFYSAVHNQPLNRYQDVLPVEATRVTLPQDDGTGRGDYINANYLDAGPMPRISRVYISTQGPTAETAIDFWRMMLHAKSTVVVMLTKMQECGRDKCFPYWPEVEQELRFGPITVQCHMQHSYSSDLTARVFVVSNSEKRATPLRVTHLHYEGWPDNDIPASTDSALKLLQLVDECNPTTPITVHCSAGIGRAGAFCTMHVISTRLKQWVAAADRGVLVEPFRFDIFETVKFLRSQRPGIICEKSQYVFVYLTLKVIADRLGVQFPSSQLL